MLQAVVGDIIGKNPPYLTQTRPQSQLKLYFDTHSFGAFDLLHKYLFET